MTEREFKKHLRDMVHGMHHPEEHDWGSGAGAARSRASAPAKAAKSTARRKKRK